MPECLCEPLNFYLQSNKVAWHSTVLSAGDTRDLLSVAVNSELTVSAGCRHRPAQAPRLSSEMTFYTTAPPRCQSLGRHSGMWRRKPVGTGCVEHLQRAALWGNMSSPSFTCEQQAGTGSPICKSSLFSLCCFDFEKFKTEMGLFKNYKLTGGKATSKQLYKGFCMHAAVKNHPLHLVLGILPSHSCLASTSFLLLKVWLLSTGPHCHFLRQHFGQGIV